VDGRTCRAKKIARFTVDARNSQKDIIGWRPLRAAGASESAGEDAVPGKAVVENGLCDKKSPNAFYARSEGYETVVSGSHWLLPSFAKAHASREHSAAIDVPADGAVVGRILKVHAASVGTPWMWTLALRHHEGRTPTHGYAGTREATMAAFAKSWRRG
jgi:hypothetical protein